MLHAGEPNDRVQRAYPIADLVIPVGNLVIPATACRAAKDCADAVVTEDLLVKLITRIIAPESWAEYGGCGTITYHPLGMALVVGGVALLLWAY